MVRKVQRRYE